MSDVLSGPVDRSRTAVLAAIPGDNVWVHLVSRGPLYVRGRRIDLDAESTDVESLSVTWGDAVRSLDRWFNGDSKRPGYEASVLRVHEDDGTALGHVVEGKALTADQAKQKGVDSRTDAYYVRLQLGTQLAQEVSRRDVPYVSPYLRIGHVDDETGEVFPVAVDEVSITANPVQKRRQVPVRDLVGVALSQTSETKLMEDGEKDVTLESLAEQLQALAARVEAMEGDEMAEDEEEMAEDGEEKMSASGETERKLADAERKIAKLEAMHRRRDAEERLSEYDVSGDRREALLKLAVENEAAFGVALSVAPKAKQRKSQPAVGGEVREDGEVDLSDPSALHLAVTRHQQANDCSYTEALSAVTNS